MVFRFGLKTGTILWPFIAHFGFQRSHDRVCRGQGWRSGESTRLPAMWPGFKSRRRRHMWVELLVCCQEPITLCCWFSPLLREVFLRVLQFSPLLKNQHFQIRSNSTWNTRTHLNEFIWTLKCFVGKIFFFFFVFPTSNRLIREKD